MTSSQALIEGLRESGAELFSMQATLKEVFGVKFDNFLDRWAKEGALDSDQIKKLYSVKNQINLIEQLLTPYDALGIDASPRATINTVGEFHRLLEK